MSPSPNVGVSTQTDVEFTQQNPLIVLVGKVNGKWTISVSDTDKFLLTGKKYSEIMDDRLKALSGGTTALKTNWQHRGVKGGPAAPDFMLDPHGPIVTREGEYVQFQCEYPFIIWAHRATSVTPNFDSPENPFGWTMSQKSTDHAPYVVNAVTAAGLTAQRFYKTVAWINVNGETILVDPDMIGI